MKEKSYENDRVLNKVSDYIKREGLILHGQKILVGVSGGADSVCLLLILSELLKSFSFDLEAVTVDHGIRGKEALEDVSFVERLCKEKGILLHICHVDVPKISKEDALSLEEAARKARYACFCDIAEKTKADAIAIAHHMEDSAETILHNLFRGSGLRGLRGLLPIRKEGSFTYIRPLLCLSRGEIEAWLSLKGRDYVTDRTNEDESYTRNYIRRQILPRIKERVNKKADIHIKQAGDIIGEAFTVISDLAEDWLKAEHIDLSGKEVILPVASLLRLRPVVRREIYLEVLDHFSERGMLKDITGAYLEKLDDLCLGKEGRSLEILGKISVYRQYGNLYFYDKKKELSDRDQKGSGFHQKEVEDETVFSEIPIEGSSDVIAVCCDVCSEVSLRIFSYHGEKFPENNYTKWLDYDTIENGLFLRYRRQGDYFYLPKGGRKSIKSYLIDKKVPVKEREHFIVLADGDHVLCTEDGRLSAICKVTDRTETVLEFSFHKEIEK